MTLVILTILMLACVLIATEREYVFYPQVPFPSVIPPAVIHIRPLWGRQDSTYESSE